MRACERCEEPVERVLRHRAYGASMTHRVTRWLCTDCHPTPPRRRRPGRADAGRASEPVVTDGGRRPRVHGVPPRRSTSTGYTTASSVTGTATDDPGNDTLGVGSSDRRARAARLTGEPGRRYPLRRHRRHRQTYSLARSPVPPVIALATAPFTTTSSPSEVSWMSGTLTITISSTRSRMGSTTWSGFRSATAPPM